MCPILSCPLYSTSSCRWILSIFGTNDHKHKWGVACNDLWSWPLLWRSSNHDLQIKLLKYGTFCSVRFTACRVLVGFFPYLIQMITGMRRCVAHNDLWYWPISPRLFSCDAAHFIEYIHMWHTYNLWDDMSCTISRLIGRRSRSHTHHSIQIFAVRAGYPSRSLMYNF